MHNLLKINECSYPIYIYIHDHFLFILHQFINPQKHITPLYSKLIMALSKTHSKKLIFIIFFVSFLAIFSICVSKATTNFAFENTSRVTNIKGMFVFGSSLVDNGNNNFFPNRAQVNYSPYGIDFPNGPTGRFTNGKNLIDLLGELLDLPNLIPPFKDPTTRGRRIIYGVNHASGSSGILDETGLIAVSLVNFHMS